MNIGLKSNLFSLILAIFYLRQLQRCSGPTCRLADGEFQKLPHVSSRAVTRTQDQCSVSPQLPITDHSVAAAPLTHPPHTHSTHYNSELLLIREEPEVEWHKVICPVTKITTEDENQSWNSSNSKACVYWAVSLFSQPARWPLFSFLKKKWPSIVAGW